MIRIDITDQWKTLRNDPAVLHHYILAIYGAERTEMAPFPYTRLLAESGQPIGLVTTYGYPRVTVQDERTYIELADVLLSLDGTERALLREQLAALAHAQWSGWMRYMFSQAPLNDDGTWTMLAWAVERWQRQMATSYDELPEEERASARAKADKVLALLDEGSET